VFSTQWGDLLAADIRRRGTRLSSDDLHISRRLGSDKQIYSCKMIAALLAGEQVSTRAVDLVVRSTNGGTEGDPPVFPVPKALRAELVAPKHRGKGDLHGDAQRLSQDQARNALTWHAVARRTRGRVAVNVRKSGLAIPTWKNTSVVETKMD
jgi:hypothetical protein